MLGQAKFSFTLKKKQSPHYSDKWNPSSNDAIFLFKKIQHMIILFASFFKPPINILYLSETPAYWKASY